MTRTSELMTRLVPRPGDAGWLVNVRLMAVMLACVVTFLFATDAHSDERAALPPDAETVDGSSGEAVGPETGLPLPRYASINASRVNLRVGPGQRYPIDWVIARRGLPVRIIGEYDNWRQIMLPDDVEGWVHHSMLSGRRSVLLNEDRLMLRHAGDESRPVARAENGLVAQLRECSGAWCRIEADGTRGWVPGAALWGIDDTDID